MSKSINDLKFNDGSTFGGRKEANKEPHRHRCWRCGEEFDCQSVGICAAGYGVIPNIINPDLSIVEHCPKTPDWNWIRAYGERRFAEGQAQSSQKSRGLILADKDDFKRVKAEMEQSQAEREKGTGR